MEGACVKTGYEPVGTKGERAERARRGQGLPSLLLPGCAHGIAEEALAVKSFFDPDWVGDAEAGMGSRGDRPGPAEPGKSLYTA